MLAARALARGFATTSRAPNAFSDLAAITSQTAPTPSAFEAAAPETAPPPTVRGYQPGVLPPKKDPVVDLFTKLLMSSGKLGPAEKQMSYILTSLQKATNQAPLPLVREAVHLAAPSIRLQSFRKGTKTTIMPTALNERQRARLGITWIMKGAGKGRKPGVTRADKIVKEILAVLEGTSEVFKKVEETHRVAMLNRYVCTFTTLTPGQTWSSGSFIVHALSSIQI